MKSTKSELIDSIATRRLRIVGSRKTALKITIGRPLKFPDSTSWFCPYEISGHDLTDSNVQLRGYSGGVDSVQALQFVTGMIAAKISYLNRTQFEGKLRWLSDSNPDLDLEMWYLSDRDSDDASAKKKK